jgi:hypothetical protein
MGFLEQLPRLRAVPIIAAAALGCIYHMIARPLRRLNEDFLKFLEVLATNPSALRMDVFWYDHALIYLARAALEGRYGGVTARQD